MQHKHLRIGQGFRIVLRDERSRAAQMTLAPDDAEAVRTTGIAAPTESRLRPIR
jgi:hypothetical protein